MPVRIRMKKMGRRHRPFYRICAVDGRRPRDGRVLEELGTYDTSLGDTDARTVLKNDRVDYWLSVGAQPSDKVGVLIKKYGTDGTRVEHAKAAREQLSIATPVPPAPAPVFVPEEPSTEPEAAAETPAAEPEATAEAPAAEAEATEAPAEAAAEESSTEEAPAKEASAEEEKPAE